jgi:GntR family transcriptional regulator
MVSPRRLALEDHRRAEFRRSRALEHREPVQTSPRRAHDLIRASIRLGLDGGRPFQTEHQLVRMMATSRNALRGAMKLLADEGLLSRRAGQGTRVSGSILSVPLSESVPAAGEVVVRQLETHLVPATPVMRLRLRTDDEWILMNEQLVEVDGEPLMLRVAYCPQSRVPTDLVDHTAANPTYEGAELAEIFPRLFGVELGRVENTVEAVPCELLLTGADGVPYSLAYCHYRGDRAALTDAVPTIPVQAGRGDSAAPSSSRL